MAVQSGPLSCIRWHCASTACCRSARDASVSATASTASPRLAGKSTVLRAILAERPTSAPVLTLAEDGELLDQLIKKSAGGYLVIPEIAPSAAMPGYIWGADVRRLFKAVPQEVSLAAT